VDLVRFGQGDDRFRIGQQYDRSSTPERGEFNKKSLRDLMDRMRSRAASGKRSTATANVTSCSISSSGKAYVGAKWKASSFPSPAKRSLQEHDKPAPTDVDIATEMADFKRNQLLMLVNILMLPLVKE